MTHLLNAIDDQLAPWLKARGQGAYRGKQIRQWIFEKRAKSFAEMTNLPQTLREELATEFLLWNSTIAHHTQADDGTEKLLLTLADGGQIECVLLRDDHNPPLPDREGQGEGSHSGRRTICISTQVGCGDGLRLLRQRPRRRARNLTTGEILEQMLQLLHRFGCRGTPQQYCRYGNGRTVGESRSRCSPALDEAIARRGLGIRGRRITISTVGFARPCGDYRKRSTLSSRRFTPRTERRTSPAHRAGEQGNYDRRRSGRGRSLLRPLGPSLTFEYVLLAEFNDRPAHAAELASILAGRTAMLNVIPYNTVAGLPYKTPSLAAQRAFRQTLEDRGVNVHFRHRKGDAIDAACGQLRRRSQQSSELVSIGTIARQAAT